MMISLNEYLNPLLSTGLTEKFRAGGINLYLLDSHSYELRPKR